MSLDIFNIDNSYGVFSNGNYETSRHSHYAIEIVYSMQGSFSIATDHTVYRNIKSAIIPPGMPHSFSCINAQCELLFFEPVSGVGKYFMQRYDLTSLKKIVVNSADLDLFFVKGKLEISRVLNVTDASVPGKMDHRILTCIETINSQLADGNVTVAELSRASFLSESRLSHLFKDQLGISVHQYILWKKILLAISNSTKGYSLTECAHQVGFSDSSHFNKAFNKTFGVNPFFVLKT